MATKRKTTGGAKKGGGARKAASAGKGGAGKGKAPAKPPRGGGRTGAPATRKATKATGRGVRVPSAARKKAISPRRKGGAAAGAPAENPAAKALAGRIAQLMLDKKAADVVVLDVRGKNSYTDYLVVGSGESDRQVSAIADGIVETLKKDGGQRPVGQEGTEAGQWLLLDYGDVVCHLFLAEARAHYDIEGLWAEVPREKLG